MGFSKLTLFSCYALFPISLIVLSANTVNADCWQTDQCQLNSWPVKGCQQYGRVEISKKKCPGGYYYTCCTPDSTSKGGGGNKGKAKGGKTAPKVKQGKGNGGQGSSSPVVGSSEVKHGKTTRYWDCCKPSCSWPDKAPVHSPVRTCAANGHSVLNSLAVSGCEGGNAFVCNSQQPFVGTDGRAYGFAAAVISGQGEQQSCCACYELTFTSGPVNGKKMVVQVTNTGHDLGQNHFDLQIPGGGFGLFNGCKPQHNKPDDVWGANKGGIDQHAQCNKLPEKLKPGCNFRFGWFKNADNPSMKFVQVACPKELVDRSGCSRK